MYVRVNVNALSSYLASKEGEAELAPQALLEQAFNALLASKVLEWVDENHQSEAPPSGARFEMEDDVLTLRWGDGNDQRSWATGRMPPWHGLVEAIAHHLASTLNERPIEGPWPKQFGP